MAAMIVTVRTTRIFMADTYLFDQLLVIASDLLLM